MAHISFQRYLKVKTAIDDRALDLRVWQTAQRHLPATRPLRVLELGAGIGTMLTRMLARGFLPAEVDYTALDADPANAEAAQAHWQRWAQAHGCACAPDRLRCPGHEVHLTWEVDDLFTFFARAQGPWDVVVAHAFLDLIDLPAALPRLFALAPRGLFYFTLNFDGVTIFEPEIDPAFDALVLAHYHRTMDERRAFGRPAGESRTGRRLLTLLPSLGARILAAGSSDWVVYPQEGRYPPGEAEFLHAILDMIEGALQGRAGLDPQRLADWLAQRRAQVDAGQLVYIAHQLDITGYFP